MAKYREDYTDPDTGVTYTDWTLRPRLVAINFNPRMPPDAQRPIDPYPNDFNRGAQPVTGTRLSDVPNYIEATVRGNPQNIISLSDRVYYPASGFFNDWMTWIPLLSHNRIDFRTDSLLIETPCFPAAIGDYNNLPSDVSGYVPVWDKFWFMKDHKGLNPDATIPSTLGMTRPVDVRACLRDPRPFFDPILKENVAGGYPNILEAVNAKYIDWLLVLGQSWGASFFGEAAMYGPDSSRYTTLKGPWYAQGKHSDSIKNAYAQIISSYDTGAKHYIFVPLQSSGLRVFDITISGSMTEKAHFPMVNARGLYAPYPDTTIYMTDATDKYGGALYILDVSDLANGNITMDQWLPLEHGNYQHGITKSGNYIIEHDGMNLRAISISDTSYTDTPFVTTATGSNTLPNSSDYNISPQLFTFGDYVVVPTINTLETYNISSLPTITWDNYFPIQNQFIAGKQMGNQIFFVGYAISGSPQGYYGSVDYLDPQNPSGDGYSSFYSGERFLGLDLDGTYAYVITDWNLRIFPMVTPYNQVGSVSLQRGNSNYVACFYKDYGGSNERLYVISDNGIIDVYNVTNKASPSYIGVAYDCTADANALDMTKGYVLQRLFASVYGEINAVVKPDNLPHAAGNFWESFHHWTEWTLGKFWYTHPDDTGVGGTESNPAGLATYGSWQYRQNPTATAYPLGSGFTDWDWFRLTDKDVTALVYSGYMDYNTMNSQQRAAGCGRPHIPPNSSGYLTYDSNDLFELANYDYGNKSFVLTTAPRWLSYPNLSGNVEWWNIYTATGFFGVEGMSGQEAWEKWWYYHLPHAEGLHTDGKHTNNWWEYIFNYQEYVTGATDPDYGSYLAAGEIGSPPTSDPALGQQ